MSHFCTVWIELSLTQPPLSPFSRLSKAAQRRWSWERVRAVLGQSAGLCGCLPPGTLSPPSVWSTYQFKARLRSTGSSSTISYLSVPGQPMDWLPVDQGPTPWPISYGRRVRSCDTNKASKCFTGAKNLTGTGMGHTLEQCFSKCGRWTSSITWNLLEMPILGPHPRPPE